MGILRVMASLDASSADPDDGALRGQGRILFKRLGLTIGALLLVAAIAVVWRNQDQITTALEAIRHPSLVHVSILLMCVLMNIILSGVLFSLLIARYGKVGILEMQALIASATLFNYLPLRPGLLGRIAYHKSINDIPATDAAKTVIQALICTVCVAAWFVLVMIVSAMLETHLWIGGMLPIAFIAVGVSRSTWRIYALAFGVRYLEVIIWALRYWAAFALLGVEINPQTSLALACISIIATMVPFLSNGLGLREWAIGLATPFLAVHITHMQIGLTAELVNRAGELIIVTITGLIGIAYLARRKRMQAL